MQVRKGNFNIFKLPTKPTDAICITTNGIIKANNRAVMGAGIAKTANDLYKLDAELASHLKTCGNTPHVFLTTGYNGCQLISFPTKHNWRDNSDLHLIKRSAEILVEICNYRHISKCYLTPPGCNLGKLNWDKDVKPILENILDDRFVVVIR